VRIFKSRWFQRFARKEEIADAVLREAVTRGEAGQIDADLGVVSSSSGLPGRVGENRRATGRSPFSVGVKVFFVYGFAKSRRNQTMEALHDVGAVDKRTMRRFDDACLTPMRPSKPEEIKAIREREHLIRSLQPRRSRSAQRSVKRMFAWEEPRSTRNRTGSAILKVSGYARISTLYSSITGFASTSCAMLSTSFCACSRLMPSAMAMSKNLPWRTSAMAAWPNPRSAARTA
jgi:hypothetical protein